MSMKVTSLRRSSHIDSISLSRTDVHLVTTASMHALPYQPRKSTQKKLSLYRAGAIRNVEPLLPSGIETSVQHYCRATVQIDKTQSCKRYNRRRVRLSHLQKGSMRTSSAVLSTRSSNTVPTFPFLMLKKTDHRMG